MFMMWGAITAKKQTDPNSKIILWYCIVLIDLAHESTWSEATLIWCQYTEENDDGYSTTPQKEDERTEGKEEQEEQEGEEGKKGKEESSSPQTPSKRRKHCFLWNIDRTTRFRQP